MVCFRGTAKPNSTYVSGVIEGGGRCVVYGPFAADGDPELLQEVCAILAGEGYRPAPRPAPAEQGGGGG